MIPILISEYNKGYLLISIWVAGSIQFLNTYVFIFDKLFKDQSHFINHLLATFHFFLTFVLWKSLEKEIICENHTFK